MNPAGFGRFNRCIVTSPGASLIGLILAFGVGGFRASADSVVLHPSADTSVHENFPENNLGGQSYFTAGTTQNGPRSRGLMAFDIASAIPVGAIVNAVSLTLEVVGQPSDGDTPSNFELHRMLTPWGEGSGTGTKRIGSKPLLAIEFAPVGGSVSRIV